MRCTTPSVYNSFDAGTAVPYNGTPEIAHGYESISVRALTSASATLTVSTGATSSSLSVVTTRALSSGVPTILAIDVNAKYYVIDVTGSGTVSVETILHASPVALPLTPRTASTTPTVVANGSTIVHNVDVGMTLNNSNCTIGVFNSSTDTTTDAFAIEVSPDNTTWYKWQLYTCTTSTLFTSFAIEGFRYARVVYSNGSGSDQTVGSTHRIGTEDCS